VNVIRGPRPVFVPLLRRIITRCRDCNEPAPDHRRNCRRAGEALTTGRGPVSTCTTGTCPHGKHSFIWLGDGPWEGDLADPDFGRYPWVHSTTLIPGHLTVCDLMPFATPEEAGEVSR
jgi:hypothetical protein